jgi:hypothetical protein
MVTDTLGICGHKGTHVVDAGSFLFISLLPLHDFQIPVGAILGIPHYHDSDNSNF